MAAAAPATPKFRLSKRGYDDLVRAEANVAFIYDDLRTGALRPLNTYEEARGTPTMGIGVAIQSEAARQQYAKYLGKTIPAAELEEINRLKLAEFENSLNRKLAGAQISQAMFDALFSLAWNTGTNSNSVNTAVAAIHRGDYATAQKAIASGPVTSKGQLVQALVTRRAREAALFAEEGLDNFVSAAQRARDSVEKSPLPYFVGVVLVAGTTFAFTRKLTA